MNNYIIEEWRPIPDFPKYEVSNLGRARSTMHSWSGLPKLMTPFQMRDGHLRVCLYKDHKQYIFYVHRLVLLVFVSPPTELNNICHHKDGNKVNNRLDNLEWSNNSSNVIASDITNGRKLDIEKVKMIRKMTVNRISRSTLAKMFNVSCGTISHINTRRTWK